MARLTKDTQFELLSKELGRVDKERREILNKMKQTPEFIAKYLKTLITSFIEKKQWFSNANAKGELSFFKLIGFNLGVPAHSAAITKHGSALISVELIWEHLPAGSYVREKKTETVIISVFNDLDKQILNGKKIAIVDEKKLLRTQLMEKKAQLKEQIKSLELELKSI